MLCVVRPQSTPPPLVHNPHGIPGAPVVAAVIVASHMHGDIPVLCRCLVWLTILACLLIMIAITLIGYFKAGILTQDQISSAVRLVESWGVGVGEGARCFARCCGVRCFFFSLTCVASGRCMLSW